MGFSGLGTLLVKEGLLTEQDNQIIGKSSGAQSWAYAKSILALGLLDEDELASLIAERTHYVVAKKDFLDLDNKAALAEFDMNLCIALEVYPILTDRHSVTVAAVDPLDHATLRQLEFFSRKKIKAVVAPLSQVQEGLQRLNPHYTPSRTTMESFITSHALGAFQHLRLREKDLPDFKIPENAAFEQTPRATAAEFPRVEVSTPGKAEESSFELPQIDGDLDSFEAAEPFVEPQPVTPPIAKAPIGESPDIGIDIGIEEESFGSASSATADDFGLELEGLELEDEFGDGTTASETNEGGIADLDAEAVTEPVTADADLGADLADGLDDFVADAPELEGDLAAESDHLEDLPDETIADLAEDPVSDSQLLGDLTNDDDLEVGFVGEEPSSESIFETEEEPTLEEVAVTPKAKTPQRVSTAPEIDLSPHADLGATDLENDITLTAETTDNLGDIALDDIVTEEAPSIKSHQRGADELADVALENTLAATEEDFGSSIDEDFAASLSDDDEQQLASIGAENDIAGHAHPDIADLNQALLYLSFANTPDEAIKTAVKAWKNVFATGFLAVDDGKALTPKSYWHSGSIMNETQAQAFKASLTPAFIKELGNDNWQSLKKVDAKLQTLTVEGAQLMAARSMSGKTALIVVGAATQDMQNQKPIQENALALLKQLAAKIEHVKGK